MRQISADSERAVATHVREELGIDPDDLPSPRTAAAASFAAFTVGALIPLSPFLLGYSALAPALVIAGIAAVAGGAAVAKLTGRSLLMGGLRQFTAAFLATGMAFVIGHLIRGVCWSAGRWCHGRRPAPGDLGHGDVLGFVRARPAWFAPGKLDEAAQAAAGPRGGAAHRRPLGDQLPLELGTPQRNSPGQARQWTRHGKPAAVTAATAMTPL